MTADEGFIVMKGVDEGGNGLLIAAVAQGHTDITQEPTAFGAPDGAVTELLAELLLG